MARKTRRVAAAKAKRAIASVLDAAKAATAANVATDVAQERFSLCSTVVNCCDEKNPPKHLIFHEKEECCCFEVFMTRLRVDKQAALDGKAEIMLTGYANEQQATFPGMGLWVQLHKNWDWRTIHKRVARFCVKKGEKLPVYLMLDAIEAGGAFEGNWEMGSSQSPASITLECGQLIGAMTLTAELKRVKNLLSSAVNSRFMVEFKAFQVNCCCK